MNAVGLKQSVRVLVFGYHFQISFELEVLKDLEVAVRSWCSFPGGSVYGNFKKMGEKVRLTEKPLCYDCETREWE